MSFRIMQRLIMQTLLTLGAPAFKAGLHKLID